jgi:hypothetical protein
VINYVHASMHVYIFIACVNIDTQQQSASSPSPSFGVTCSTSIPVPMATSIDGIAQVFVGVRSCSAPGFEAPSTKIRFSCKTWQTASKLQLGPDLEDIWEPRGLWRKAGLHHYKDLKGTQARIAHLLTCNRCRANFSFLGSAGRS